jgi:tetratricopeptide (TPR) repeat protein
LYQASYFSKNDIDCREALLADNSFYAFNDWWQLLIEIGTMRFLGLLFLSLLIFTRLRQCCVQKERRFLFDGALSGLLCIATASLFSNPFQFFGLQLISILFLLAILTSISLPGSISRHAVWILSSLEMSAFAGLLLLGLYNYGKIRVISNSKKAFDLYQAGFKGEALNRYSVLQHSSFKYGPLLLQYARSLYNSNRLQEAKNMISETKKYYSDNEVYKLSAAIEFETGDIVQAQKEFKTALYMVPNRMKTRFELFRFYLTTRDTVQAIFWGNSLLNMPVKIPSATVEDLKEKTKALLEKIQHTPSTEKTLHPFY